MAEKKDTETLSAEIRQFFSYVDMPIPEKLTLYNESSSESEYLIRDLEEYRGKPVSQDLLRGIHQELSLLSAEAFAWIMPYFLEYCLSAEGQESQGKRMNVI